MAEPRSSSGSGESSGRGRVTRTRITRVFLDHSPKADASFALPAMELRHLRDVLRARPGETFEVVGSDGSVSVAELLESGEAVVVEALEPPESSSVEVALYQAVPKGKRMDFVVEKSVEIGATRITPLVSERSVVRVGEEGGKLERWRRISESAARQSLRREVPEVASPVAFREALEDVKDPRSAVVLHNEPGLPALEEVVSWDVSGVSPVNLFVGPEGGWSDEELRLAREVGASLARIGAYRLRSETAGIVAVARARASLEPRESREARE